MARCDEGYRCLVCGEPVEEITDSALYLGYVTGRIPYEVLHREPECHLRCNPVQAQFIVHDDFEPVVAAGAFDKRSLDPEDVRREEQLATRGWLRLKEVSGSGLPVAEYPLPEVLEQKARV